MSEALAHRLKTFCRLYFAGALLYLWLSRQPESAAPALFLLVIILLMLVSWLAIYLSFFLGVDVVGLARLLGVPTGKPFHGLQPGEEDRLRFRFTRGSLNWAGYGGVFKLRLTNQRLLVGANLTSWYLLEIPLEEVTTVAVGPRRWLTSTLRLTQVGLRGTQEWRVGLTNRSQFEKLVAELKRLGLPVQDRPS